MGANQAWRVRLKNNNPRVVLRIPVSVSDFVQRLSTDTSVSGVVPDQIDAKRKAPRMTSVMSRWVSAMWVKRLE